MSLEAPFLAAIIARLGEPKENLAAFGVSFAVAILVESPIIMILSASTALVVGPVSFRRLRNFMLLSNLLLTLGMLAAVLSPAWMWIAAHALDLPEEVARLTRTALLIMVPWPGAIGYRRFYQGLLIRTGETRKVAYGTVIRMSTVALATLGLFLFGDLPGAWVAAWGLTLGVCAEAAAARFMARRAVGRFALGAGMTEEETARDQETSYRRILVFYWPLALTSMISLAVQPVVTFFMGHARYPLESLAVLPVVNSLSFIFRSVGLSYQEVAIALLGEEDANFRPVSRFGMWLGGLASITMGLIVFTPLAGLWFHTLSGLTDELVRFAMPPARILTLLPVLSVLLSLQRAILVHGRNTGPITWAAALEVTGIVGTLTLLTTVVPLVGATAAAVAFISGRIGCNLVLIPPCRRVGASRGG